MPWILLHQTWQIYPRPAGKSTPQQLSTDGLNTITPNLAYLSRICQQVYPSIKHRCLEYHYTKLGRSHIWQICLADLPPCQSSIDALHTITPNLADLLADLIFGISALQIYPLQSSIDALNTITPNLADLLADLIFGRSAWQIYPLPIKHRCLAYHYTELGRSTPLIQA